MNTKTLMGIALIVLLSTLTVSFGQTGNLPQPAPIPTKEHMTTATLAGRLVDEGGNPISGALVDCFGPDGTTSFVTGANGSYRFNLVRSGHYTIQPRIGGFSPSQADFDVIVPGADFVRP